MTKQWKRFSVLCAVVVFAGIINAEELLNRDSTNAVAPLKVGVFRYAFGGRSVYKALKNDSTFEVKLLKKLTQEATFACDVIFIGGCSFEQPQLVNTTRLFANCGGGVVLNHSACGRSRPETIFPTVVEKVGERREDNIMVVKDKQHIVTDNLPKQFEIGFNDHLRMIPGANGKAVIVDRQGVPIVVAGKSGSGRIVFNGGLPGYWYDPTDYKQGEKEPQGAELQLVKNMLRWAGRNRITKMDAKELAIKRERIAKTSRIESLQQVVPNSDWFGMEMIRGSHLALPPVTELGGKYFISYDTSWRRFIRKESNTENKLTYVRHRLEQDLRKLKWIGITDVVYWVDVEGSYVYRPTNVADSDIIENIDYLAELIPIATKLDMNIWTAWHSASRKDDLEFAKKYCAKNAKGDFYQYGDRHFVEDYLSPAYFQRCVAFLDEYVKKYKPLGNFKGIQTYDEYWFNYVDFHEDDLPAIKAFCLKNFGEAPPADFANLLAKGKGWENDLWRRRYILFKQNVTTEFFKKLIPACHQRGLQIGLPLMYIPNSWYYGADNVNLARLGADFLIGTEADEAAYNSYPNIYRWAHIYNGWGYYNTHCLKGGPGGLYFTYNQLWRPIVYGSNPDVSREFARHIHLQRSWANSEQLAQVAVLYNENALEMLCDDARIPFNQANAIFKTIQERQDAEKVYSLATEQHNRFKLLVATPYSVRGLSKDAYSKITDFVNTGGIIVSVAAKWSVARSDFTKEEDHTQDITGTVIEGIMKTESRTLIIDGESITLNSATPCLKVKADNEVKILAEFSDGSPAITEYKLGKGAVIALHFNAGYELEAGNNPELSNWLRKLIQERSHPAIWCEGTGYQMVSVLRKGNWLAVALYPNQPPTKVVLHVDPKLLGIKQDEFRVMMMGKRMEIDPPRALLGSSAFWSCNDLKNGFTVTLTDAQNRYLPLPDKYEFQNSADKEEKWRQEYYNDISRSYWDSEKRGKRKRETFHEIVVIGPANEAYIPQNTNNQGD